MMSQLDWQNAPFNQVDDEPIEVDCCVSYCISKTMPVQVEKYNTTMVDDSDGEGRHCHLVPEYSFEDTNFIEEFKSDNKALGIPTLLKELQRLCEEKVKSLEDEFNLTNNHNLRKKVRKEHDYYKTLIKASKDWVVDDLDVIQEE